MSKKNGPGLRIAGGFKQVSELAEKLSAAVREIDERIEEDKEHTSALFEVAKGKPVVEVVGPDGVLSTEPFSEAVDSIWEQDDREIEIWAGAFAKAAEKLKSVLRHPKKS